MRGQCACRKISTPCQNNHPSLHLFIFFKIVKKHFQLFFFCVFPEKLEKEMTKAILLGRR